MTVTFSWFVFTAKVKLCLFPQDRTETILIIPLCCSGISKDFLQALNTNSTVQLAI